MNKEIEKILKEFDDCHFCEDEGGLMRKIHLYLPKFETYFEKRLKEESKKLTDLSNYYEAEIEKAKQEERDRILDIIDKKTSYGVSFEIQNIINQINLI